MAINQRYPPAYYSGLTEKLASQNPKAELPHSSLPPVARHLLSSASFVNIFNSFCPSNFCFSSRASLRHTEKGHWFQVPFLTGRTQVFFEGWKMMCWQTVTQSKKRVFVTLIPVQQETHHTFLLLLPLRHPPIGSLSDC